MRIPTCYNQHGRISTDCLMVDASRRSGAISVTSARIMAYKATFLILCIISVLWFTAVGAVIFSLEAFDSGNGRTISAADGSIYMSAFFLALVFNVAIIAPGLLLLQPTRLRHVLWHERRAITPRQRFRGESFLTCVEHRETHECLCSRIPQNV